MTRDDSEDISEETGLDPHAGYAVNLSCMGLIELNMFYNDQILGHFRSVMSG